MECQKCNLRYNLTNRLPKINQCGHTICESCNDRLQFCPICKEINDPKKVITNLSLLELLSPKKISNKDIDKIVKVCFVGESKVGKTSLINRMKGEEFKTDTIVTIGYDFAFQDKVLQGLNIRYQLWDSAGQERYRAISPLHYKNADILVILYDVTASGKENRVSEWYLEALKHCPEHVIKIIIGNKIDLLEERPNVKRGSPLDQETWKIIAEEKIVHFQMSCKNNEGLDNLWNSLQNGVKLMMKRTPSMIRKEEDKKSPQKSPKPTTGNSKLKSKIESPPRPKDNCC